MLFLAALDKMTREELLDLATASQGLRFWVVSWDTLWGGLWRFMGYKDFSPLENHLKKFKQDLEDLTDQGLRRRLYNTIAELAGVSEADRADPEKVAHQALVVAAGHLGINTDQLSPSELERQVCEKSIQKMMEQLEEKLKQMSPEEEARLEEHLRDLLEKMSAGEQEAIRQALGMEKLTAQALLAVLRTGTLTLGTLAALNMAGFGVFLAAATGLKAVALLLGIALPFKAYLAVSTALGVILGPLGWTAAAGIIGLVGYFQKNKIDGELLCQLITAMHYRLTRE